MPAAATYADPGARSRAGTAGVVAAGAAVATTELLAGLIDSVPSLLAAVGGVVIDRSPPWLKDAAIEWLGAADKAVLALGTVVLSLVVGWFAGIAAVSRRWIGVAVFSTFGIAGYLAGVGEPLAEPGATAGSVLVSVLVGLGFLEVLLRAGRVPDPTDAVSADGSRRRFLGAAAGGAAAAAAAGVVGRRLLSSLPSVPPVEPLVPGEPVGTPGPDEAFALPGLSPVVTPNDSFYRIDTALVIPRIDPASWRLRIHGAVDREIELTYDDLRSGPLVEEYVTIACVSNEVGGGLVGNAAWSGIPLVGLLEEAGVRAAGTQIVGRSIDGFTAGFPTEAAFDGRSPLVAIGMNGEPLPRRHGFPARLVVPGLYGYVSATKWLTEIELTGWDDFDGYWIPRGWAKEAPIKTQSRIDVPRRGSRVSSPFVAAGVAWAPTLGIEGVEVRLDEGEWRECELSDALSSRAWVQWRIRLEAQPGAHRIRVRATDGTGRTQTAEVRPPRPDGASGHHSVRFSVR